MRVDLPYDPETGDIVFKRDADGAHFNIPQRIILHSPTGFEWGYGGGGPADFALNILDRFIPVDPDAPHNCRAHNGAIYAREAGDLHQKFKWQFIATAPREGGTIRATDIRLWIAYQRGDVTLDDVFTADSRL